MITSLNPITLSNKIQQMGDPRTRDYPVVMSPLFVFPMILSYLYFVRVAGPRWMKNREPFKIVNIIRLYNLIMVYLNAKFLVAVLSLTYLPGGRYSLWCQGITGYMDDDFERFYKFGWFFVSVRYADFLDTVFFVLRKKFTQITHLHVIHHTIVAVNVWFFVLFAPEGQVALGLSINVFVHVIMYSYYFLATFGPAVQSMNPVIFLSQIQQMGDPRTRDYPLVVNPFFVFPLIVGYLYFVKVAGPRWMKDREPFDIINIVRVYNLGMVAVNARFLYIVLKTTYLPGGRYSLWCQGITGYMDEELTQYYKDGWFFVAVRYVDFLDTVFFVLRKKFRQITHLHVIHHTIVAANVWFWTLFAPEGHVAFGLAINVFVHIIMYSYYFLATLGPGVQKYLWWKNVRLGYCATEAHSWARDGASASTAAMTSLPWNAQTAEARAAGAAPARQLCSHLCGCEARALAYTDPHVAGSNPGQGARNLTEAYCGGGAV
ncbi:hypothetical protein HPB47_022112 [Ixodes persulcatus]|uniref:Uncharacterized protein n=1 Tax=Ixodes persulcatus TaxID=34615 RepID=A0AC60QB11_IXOPE|nr:hypothetical protein HPB47_022112 [Ixodes persulcatus]